jgi:adenosine deaminase
LDSITPEFIRAIPKTDLHVHLDGSLRLDTLVDLARTRKVELPSYTEEGLRELVFKERYQSLVEYLQGFRYTVAVLQDPEALERTAYELALDNQAEGVRYLEVRFAPQLHVHSRLDMEEVLQSVDRGLARAQREDEARPEVVAGTLPPFRYGIIVCALRMFDESSSVYFRSFLDVHRYSRRTEIYSMASDELVRAAVSARDRLGLPIVGFDLAGQEYGYPAVDHARAYRYAHKHFLKKTVHAGEAYGPESIFQAITDLYADRIGHGYHLFSPDMVHSPLIEDREAYVDALVRYISDRRITIEVCLTSNLQTLPGLASMEEHAFHKMLEARLSVTLCTDNRLMSRTTVSDEVLLATRHFEISPRMLKNIIIYGFKRSFYPGSYPEKRRYVRHVIDYYEQIQREFSNENEHPESQPH